MTVMIKFCGLNDKASVEKASELNVEFAGFVFNAESPRSVSPELAQELADMLPAKTKKVAVTVNMTDEMLGYVLADFHPDYLQLHGDETPERAKDIKRSTGCKIIRAIKLKSKDDLKKAKFYEDIASILLFDAAPPEGAPAGGNGVSFDWEWLKGFETPLPWFLSGGLNVDNVAEAVMKSGARRVDVSSGIEGMKGVKDPAKMEAFAEAVRAI